MVTALFLLGVLVPTLYMVEKATDEHPEVAGNDPLSSEKSDLVSAERHSTCQFFVECASRFSVMGFYRFATDHS